MNVRPWHKKVVMYALGAMLPLLVAGIVFCAYNWAAAIHSDRPWAEEWPPVMGLYVSIPVLFGLVVLAILDLFAMSEFA